MISFTKENIFLITGASSGIGRAAAKLFNKLGATVIANGRNESELQLLKTECENPDNLFIEEKDLTSDIENLPAWVKSLKEKYGRLQGLVCSAGITETEPISIFDYNTCKKVMDINYFVPIMLTKGFANKRIITGIDNTIVFVSSFAVHKGNKGQTAYIGSKGALVSSMRTIANELLHKGVRVNALSPSYTDTPMVTNALDDGKIMVMQEHKYIAKPSHMADIIVFLSSHQSEWINGQDIIANRGAYYLTQQI